MRYFFEITYDGRNYSGWQTQHNATGVQQVIEHALSTLESKPMKTTGSGRTDAGVHCVQQFFHADFEGPVKAGPFMHRLNSFLPRDIAIRSIRKVRSDADARRDAIRRTYEYHLTLIKDPLMNGYALHYFKPLDFKLMNSAATMLLGEQDFQCFSKVKTDVNHFICRVTKARWSRKKDAAVFTITANRFLRGMVRSVVGTMLMVGSKECSLADFKNILQSHDRRKAGPNVAPYGLYLKEVRYPHSIFIR